jgi:hypothetical protein
MDPMPLENQITVTCGKCGSVSPGNLANCPACGRLLDPVLKKQPPLFSSASFDPNEKEKDDRNMDRARWIILAVAILTIIASLYQWYSFESELSKLKADPLMQIIPGKVEEARVLLLGSLVVGAIFVGLYFWAKRNPFGAALTALLIYAADTALPLIFLGNTSRFGIVRILFLIVLIKGTHSGYRYRKEMRGLGTAA